MKRELSFEDTQDLESMINDAMSLVKDQDDKIEQSLMIYIS